MIRMLVERSEKVVHGAGARLSADHLQEVARPVACPIAVPAKGPSPTSVSFEESEAVRDYVNVVRRRVLRTPSMAFSGVVVQEASAPTARAGMASWMTQCNWPLSHRGHYQSVGMDSVQLHPASVQINPLSSGQ